MELSTDSRCAANSLPRFQVVIANRSQAPVRLCAYMLEYRLKAAMVAVRQGAGADYELQPFQPVTWRPFATADLVTLEPGQKLEHTLQLPGEGDFGFIQRRSQPPVIPKKWVIAGFPAGTFAFNTAISDQMGIYVGAPGVFDHRLEGRKIPRDLPDAGSPEGVFTDLLEASATVTFA